MTDIERLLYVYEAEKERIENNEAMTAEEKEEALYALEWELEGDISNIEQSNDFLEKDNEI